jgi:hypothetical protein
VGNAHFVKLQLYPHSYLTAADALFMHGVEAQSQWGQDVIKMRNSKKLIFS